MKTIIFAGLTLLSYISIIGSIIWCIVSFTIYLVKDIPFNWLALWVLIGSVVLTILSGILTVIFSVKSDQDYKKMITPKKQHLSRWEQRLRDAEEERKIRQ